MSIVAGTPSPAHSSFGSAWWLFIVICTVGSVVSFYPNCAAAWWYTFAGTCFFCFDHHWVLSHPHTFCAGLSQRIFWTAPVPLAAPLPSSSLSISLQPACRRHFSSYPAFWEGEREYNLLLPSPLGRGEGVQPVRPRIKIIETIIQSFSPIF